VQAAEPPSTNFTFQFYNGTTAVGFQSELWSESGIVGPLSWSDCDTKPINRIKIWQRQQASPGVVYIDAVTDGSYTAPDGAFAHYVAYTGTAVAFAALVANAREDVEILTKDQTQTTIYGMATDPDPVPSALTYRWLEGQTQLQDWTAVGTDGAANLSLGAVPAFSRGASHFDSGGHGRATHRL
jgi:hypothetical protein